MKKNPITIAFLLIVLSGILAACANKYYTSAMSQIKKNNITTATISNLEQAAKDDKCKIESLYQLARIYHYNQKLQDLNKAHQCYQDIVLSSNNPKYKSQFEKIAKKHNVTIHQINKNLSEVEVLIDNQEYNQCIKDNTIKAYGDFVFKHPYSKHIEEAKDKAFKKAKEINTFESYEEFMRTFPDRKSSAIESAFQVAKRENTIADYKTYLNMFGHTKLNEVDDLAYEVAKKQGTIQSMEEYMSSIPNAKHRDEATVNKEQLTFKEYFTTKTHTSKNYADKVRDLDDFISKHNSKTYQNCAIQYFHAILNNKNSIPLEEEYDNLTSIPYKSNCVRKEVYEYLANEVLLYAEGQQDLPNAFILYDGVSYTAMKSAEEIATLREEPNINLTNTSKILNIRIERCNHALSRFPAIDSKTKNYIKDRINKDRMFMEYYPIKHFYDEIDRKPYNEKAYQDILSKIAAIQNNAEYRQCTNWMEVNDILNDVSRKITNKKDEKRRNDKIAENSIYSKWEIGDEVCKSVPGGIVYGNIEQKEKNNFRVSIVAAPSGFKNGNDIVHKGDLIWFPKDSGWHLTLQDEKEYALEHNSAKSSNAKTRCSHCGGKGEEICHVCNGKGYITNTYSTAWGSETQTRECDNCFGKGYTRCTHCLGHGYELEFE